MLVTTRGAQLGAAGQKGTVEFSPLKSSPKWVAWPPYFR